MIVNSERLFRMNLPQALGFHIFIIHEYGIPLGRHVPFQELGIFQKLYEHKRL